MSSFVQIKTDSLGFGGDKFLNISFQIFYDYSVTCLWIFLCNWSQIYWGWSCAKGEWAQIRSHLSHGRGRQVFLKKYLFLEKKTKKLI